MAKKKQTRSKSGRFASKSDKKKTVVFDETVTPEKENEAISKPAVDQPVVDKGKPAAYERQPAFEQKIAEPPSGQEAPGPEEKEPWGGAREGAGRKRGTDDLARVNALPEKANEQICPVLKIPFKFWAKSQKVPDLALSDKEAKEWALPITKLLEFYFPGRIPEIAWVWLMFVGSSFEVLDKRMEIIQKAREEKKAATPVSPHGGAGPIPVKPGPRQNQIVTVDEIDKAAAYNVEL